jgi:hypothetical protein
MDGLHVGRFLESSRSTAPSPRRCSCRLVPDPGVGDTKDREGSLAPKSRLRKEGEMKVKTNLKAGPQIVNR